MNTEVVLLTGGGMDSLVALAALFQEFDRDGILLLHANYGQTAGPREWEAVLAQAKHYGLQHPIEMLLLTLYGSTMTGGEPVRPDMPHYVPNRNMILIAYAAAAAARLDCHRVAGGWQAGDTSCPDVQPQFIHLVERALQVGMDMPFRVLSPVGPLTKYQVVCLGSGLKVPWHLAWSCFEGDEEPCGECLGCTRRELAFKRRDNNDG